MSTTSASVGSRLLCVVLVTACRASSIAQDPQMAQQEWVPLLLNPASAGSNDRQAVLVHRKQWKPYVDPFRTMTGSFDLCVTPTSRTKKRSAGRIGVGAVFLNDRAGAPEFRTTSADLHLAYHVKVAEASTIGAGFYFGARQQATGPNNGSWAAQYDGMHYDPSLPTGERFGAAPRTVADMGAGVLYNYNGGPGSRKAAHSPKAQAGMAIYHAARPRLSSDPESTDRLPRRISLFAQAEMPVGGRGFAVEPRCFAQVQGGFSMVQAGAAFRIALPEKKGFMMPEHRPAMSIGGYYRTTGVLVSNVVFSWGEYAVSLAYDMNMVASKRPVNGKGAAEIGLRYVIPAASGRP